MLHIKHLTWWYILISWPKHPFGYLAESVRRARGCVRQTQTVYKAHMTIFPYGLHTFHMVGQKIPYDGNSVIIHVVSSLSGETIIGSHILKSVVRLRGLIGLCALNWLNCLRIKNNFFYRKIQTSNKKKQNSIPASQNTAKIWPRINSFSATISCT